MRLCVARIRETCQNDHMRAQKLRHFLCSCSAELVCMTSGVDSRLLTLASHILPLHMTCSFRPTDRMRHRTLTIAFAMLWLVASTLLACASLEHVASLYNIPLYVLPPLMYPLCMCVVWASMHLSLYVPFVRAWVFALENGVAVCGDRRALSFLHLSRSRASKTYAGAKTVELSAVSLRNALTGMYVRMVLLHIPPSAKDACPSIICDAIDMATCRVAMSVECPVLVVLCDEAMCEPVSACFHRLGYYVCAHAGLGGVVAVPSDRGSVTFDTQLDTKRHCVVATVIVELHPRADSVPVLDATTDLSCGSDASTECGDDA
jgi:hypothetical protein